MAALTETPPPTLEEVARRTDCTPSALRHRFPELYTKLVHRLPERKAFLREQQRAMIQLWFSLSFYGELAGTAIQFEKGDKINVIGSIEQREFTPHDGSTRKIYEVIVKQCRLVERPRTAASERDSAAAVSESSRGEVDAWSVL